MTQFKKDEILYERAKSITWWSSRNQVLRQPHQYMQQVHPAHI